MLLDLTDGSYLRDMDNSLKQSNLIDRHNKYETIMKRWFNRDVVSYIDIIMRDTSLLLNRCDMCGVTLNSINTPIDYRYVMSDGVLCTDCNDHLIRGFSLSNELNRAFIEARVSTEFTRLILESENL